MKKAGRATNTIRPPSEGRPDALKPKMQHKAMIFLATATPDLRLADLEIDTDFTPLDELIAKYAGGNCLDFEFNDDNYKPGYRTLEYNVDVLVRGEGYDWDDDMSRVAETSRITECVKVRVSAEQSIDLIARAIAAEIRGIEGNVHA